MATEYNVIVIGAGSAGLVAAYISAAVKAKVLLVERHKMGGDCLNTGCVPSKALIRTARFVSDMNRHKELGVKSVNYEIDFAEIMERVHEKIRKIEPHDSPERYRGLGVELAFGDAEIVDSHTVKVEGETYKAKSIVLATGASPFIPPIKGIDCVPYRTSENLWSMREQPKRMVVLGGGPIGSEMTQAFQRLGTQVTQVEMLDRILAKEDEDVASFMADRFQKEGVELLTSSKASEVMVREDGGRVLICETPEGRKEVPFDELLIAVGRRANTQGFDWDKLGIKLNQNGTIAVDEYMRANGSNIYACGDVTGPFQFTHASSHQAWFCAVNALFSPLKKFKIDYRFLPWVTFTDPEVAQVGYNEQAAEAAGLAYEKTIYDIGDLDRAVAESEDHGFIKVLTKPGKDEILGATVVSHNGGELISEFVTCMKHGLGLNKILGTIHAYPTYAEANKFAAGNWKKAHAPETILGYLEKFHGWRR